MANYTIPENPQYITEIRKLEKTDPANAELFNVLLQILINNTHAVKREADGIEILQERLDIQQAELSGKADNAHQHDAGDISGIMTITQGGTGNTTGQAASAVKLAAARSIRTNLASASSVDAYAG